MNKVDQLRRILTTNVKVQKKGKKKEVKKK